MNLACRAKAEVDSSLPGADPDERQRACEMWGVRFSLDNLMGYPWIKSAVDGGELLLHGLYFDMAQANCSTSTRKAKPMCRWSMPALPAPHP